MSGDVRRTADSLGMLAVAGTDSPTADVASPACRPVHQSRPAASSTPTSTAPSSQRSILRTPASTSSLPCSPCALQFQRHRLFAGDLHALELAWRLALYLHAVDALRQRDRFAVQLALGNHVAVRIEHGVWHPQRLAHGGVKRLAIVGCEITTTALLGPVGELCRQRLVTDGESDDVHAHIDTPGLQVGDGPGRIALAGFLAV